MSSRTLESQEASQRLAGDDAIFSTLISIYYYQKYQVLLASNVKNTWKEALYQLAYSEREYNNVQYQNSSTSDLLGHRQSLYDCLRHPNPKNLAILEEVWSSVAVNQKWYRQIRFFNLEGRENVRINYDFKTGTAAAARTLQDKSDREYFQYAQILPCTNQKVQGVTEYLFVTVSMTLLS